MVADASGIVGGVSGEEMSGVLCFEGRKVGGGVRGLERISAAGSEAEHTQTSACG